MVTRRLENGLWRLTQNAILLRVEGRGEAIEIGVRFGVILSPPRA